MSVMAKLLDRVLSGPDRREIVAQRLYAALAAQARRPEFFQHAGVPDTVDGPSRWSPCMLFSCSTA
jgi:hypothetical protein